ncbi:MAG: TlpA family protein disulfide reductase [Deferrisomatales bacterium]
MRLVLAALVGLALAGPPGSASARLAVSVGEPFPDLAFEALVAPDDHARLGLPGSPGPFRLSQVPGELLVLEFFNRFCLTCVRQAPYLESFYQAVQTGDLTGRVRVLGVGVGNRTAELLRFRREHGLAYPLASDPEFERFLQLGDPGGTPFTLFLLRRPGGWVLGDFHLGMQGDTELLARTRVLLEGRSPAARLESPEAGKDYHPPLGLGEAAQEEAARRFLSRLAGTPVKIDAVEVDGARVYRVVGPEGRPTGLMARVASRAPVCDVCHAVHFLFAFDLEGRARGFEPIHVTKFGNELWSPRDNARLEGRLVGRALKDLVFDAEVDAVTSATMSSTLIFDEVRRAAALLPALGAR